MAALHQELRDNRDASILLCNRVLGHVLNPLEMGEYGSANLGRNGRAYIAFRQALSNIAANGPHLPHLRAYLSGPVNNLPNYTGDAGAGGKGVAKQQLNRCVRDVISRVWRVIGMLEVLHAPQAAAGPAGAVPPGGAAAVPAPAPAAQAQGGAAPAPAAAAPGAAAAAAAPVPVAADASLAELVAGMEEFVIAD